MMAMKLWLIYQDRNDGYDTYSSAVVVAETEDAARAVHPGGDDWRWHPATGKWVARHGSGYGDDTWTNPESVGAVCIGTAKENMTPGRAVCSSFNAG